MTQPVESFYVKFQVEILEIGRKILVFWKVVKGNKGKDQTY